MVGRGLVPDLVQLALQRATGATFEGFSQDFLGAILGRDYVPLGGMHDGGADGFLNDTIFTTTTVATTFAQASTEKRPAHKIRETVRRLRQGGRTPHTVIYITSQVVKEIDKVQADLSDELAVGIRIYDAMYIQTHINDSPRTIAAFENHLSAGLAWLKSVGDSTADQVSKYAKSPTVYVFLRQEIEGKRGHESLADAVTDALILWALEGSDTEHLMSKEQVLAKIFGTISWAGTFVDDRLNERLRFLSSKSRLKKRIRRYPKVGSYCLPRETREALAQEAAQEEALLLSVVSGLYRRIEAASNGELSPAETRDAAAVALRALQLQFEHQGLELAAFISRESGTSMAGGETVEDAIREAMDFHDIDAQSRPKLGDAILKSLRGVFYGMSESEQLYLGKLSRTYSILFTLTVEPRLVSYFQEMAADFRLYVGSDILLRALSERSLSERDQQHRNVLRLADGAGATLLLAEPVLDEVLGNLRLSDRRYRELYLPMGKERLREAEDQAPILLLSYFATLDERDGSEDDTESWPEFANQFIEYGDLHTTRAKPQLREYLCRKFHMKYESRDDLMEAVDRRSLDELAGRLEETKKDPILASNDALMALAVYGRREELKEHSTSSEFGFRTWWLTSESRILQSTRDIVEAHEGVRYILRPEFLLNFLALAPSAEEVRDAYRGIFPTALGVQLSKRMDEAVFLGLMERVRRIASLEPERRQAQMTLTLDELKGDFAKVYRNRFLHVARPPVSAREK